MKFLHYAQTLAPNHRTEGSPLRHGESDWTFKVSRRNSKISIFFENDRDPGTVRVAVNYDSLYGHIAFLSVMPQLLGGKLYAVNGNPEEEGNRLFERFLTFINGDATVATVFTEVASMIEAGDFTGIALDKARSLADPNDYRSPHERNWEILEEQI